MKQDLFFLLVSQVLCLIAPFFYFLSTLSKLV